MSSLVPDFCPIMNYVSHILNFTFCSSQLLSGLALWAFKLQSAKIPGCCEYICPKLNDVSYICNLLNKLDTKGPKEQIQVPTWIQDINKGDKLQLTRDKYIGRK